MFLKEIHYSDPTCKGFRKNLMGARSTVGLRMLKVLNLSIRIPDIPITEPL